MAQEIRSRLRYNNNWGGSDPIWYALTTNSGNCFVHAKLLEKALNKAGISNQIISTTKGEHYWNLTSSGIHYDATPNHIVEATSEEKYNALKARGWDWPAGAPIEE